MLYLSNINQQKTFSGKLSQSSTKDAYSKYTVYSSKQRINKHYIAF